MEIEILQQKEIKRVPKLRFGEFEKDWNSTKLSKVAKIERGRFSPRPRNNPIYYGGKIPFVQTSDVVNSKGRILNYSQTLNEKGLKVSKQFDKGTILITIAANIGYAGVLQIDMACPDSLIGISCHNNLFNYFLNYQLEIEQPRMDYLAVAAAQKNINIEFLKPYKFNLPSLPEQQKIASFLSAVDKKSQQLTNKKELLETYKKGVMQKLFSQEVRFKTANGKDFPEWEENILGEISTNICYGMNAASKEFDGVNKYIRITDIDDKSRQLKSEIVTSPEGILDTNFLVEKGDLLFTRTGASVGKSYLHNLSNDKYFFAGFLIRFSIKDANPYFIFSQTLTQKYRKWVNIMSMRSGQPGINAEEYKNFKIKLPVIEEQQKIADFLSALDGKIETVQQQITKTESFKKGLLQQMFV